jgi:hypothetical protein
MHVLVSGQHQDILSLGEIRAGVAGGFLCCTAVRPAHLPGKIRDLQLLLTEAEGHVATLPQAGLTD